ncbi:formylglycine-generating enzyme family protein [Hydrogenophaga sp. BPS33]|uniref:formylglycine-generating enzyme family protein n=1 Tax=Hydrogenophaga sp. BPS33 TaxID=2651974 RepID=UPI00132012F0|nr:formylglycine-generating enzyme family protein [Hydrogenophaga sp. BPS33]QHE83879.1 formylglycine-generating enzyme family protein [Hydrogenophaga sp. BPS33]
MQRSTIRFLLSLVGVAVLACAVGSSLVVAAAHRGSARAPDAAALCERYSGLPDDHGMVRLPGGRFTMGSDRHYAEEGPTHEAVVEPFWIDRHDVTNAQFARFVAATGYVTVAERGGPTGVAASAVFVMPEARKAGAWRLVPGADWRHPQGSGSSIEGLGNHPVVQVAHEDAQAYARWAGRALPTEAQWEFAARGGLHAQTYVWGETFAPQDKPMANTWHGAFPFENRQDDGFAGTSPVGCFAANGYGLYDMAGNVWQWTATVFAPHHDRSHDGFDPAQPDAAWASRAGAAQPAPRVIKGGSHLCAPSFCMRYRPSARQPAEPGLGTSHIGFRTVAAVPPANAVR